MKSAFELALERSGGALDEIPEEKKVKITEIDTICKSKIAEAELSANERIMKAGGDVAEISRVKEDLTVELASIRSKYEREKDSVRNS